MVKIVQHVRHNTAGADAYTGRAGEITVDITRNDLRVHDGVTAGGNRVANLTAVIALIAAALSDAEDYADAADAALIAKALVTAGNQVLIGTANATPAVLDMGASTILARLASGDVKAATPAEIRTLLGLVIGTNVQAYDEQLADIAALSPTDGYVIIGDGSNFGLYDLAGALNALGELALLNKSDVPKYAFPATTKAIFIQSAAPTYWTQDTTNNDKVIRIVNDDGGGDTGGSWTISGVTVDGHALTVDEIPAHTHSTEFPGTIPVGEGGNNVSAHPTSTTKTSGSAGGGDPHSHGLTADGNWRPAYIDALVATKDNTA